jgi:hypothetical protein
MRKFCEFMGFCKRLICHTPFEDGKLVGDIFQTKPETGPYKKVFRQYSAMNKYNKQGITVYGILLGLKTEYQAQLE